MLQSQSTSSDLIPSPSHSDRPDFPVNILDRFRKKVTAYFVRFKPFRTAFRQLSRWVEFEGETLAKATHEQTIRFELTGEGQLKTLRIGRQKQNNNIDIDSSVWEFLAQIGIKHLTCDVRLESNQIDDVLMLLYTIRRDILRYRRKQRCNATVAHLTGPEGIHYACTHTTINGDGLTIVYSYCVLRYSRVVRWFESKHRNFRDHRALFYAGPRYAILIGLIATAPGIIHGFNYGNWYIFAVSIIEAVFIMPIIYLFFMVVGSIEYDNEEKAYKLTRTNIQLKEYNDRIQADIQRARNIQQNLLPADADMPFPEKIDWSCLYRPEEQVGGDYFDAQRLPDNRVVILFSDVSGHGLGAAFVTAIIKTTFQGWLDNPTELSDLMHLLNRALCRLIPVESFAAIFAAIYDIDATTLTYINGGHHPEPLLLPADPKKDIQTLSQARSLLLGIQEEVDFDIASQTLSPGDRLLFISDGIVEAHNIDRQLYTTEKFHQWMQANRDCAFDQLNQRIMSEIDSFSRYVRQGDDQTILALQIKNQPGPTYVV